jgi:hypothetical protein
MREGSGDLFAFRPDPFVLWQSRSAAASVLVRSAHVSLISFLGQAVYWRH